MGDCTVSFLSPTSLSPLQSFLAAGWLYQGCGCAAAGDPGGDTRSWSVQVWGTSRRPSFRYFGGQSQALLLFSAVKISALAGCWRLQGEPQLQFCGILRGLLSAGELGQ